MSDEQLRIRFLRHLTDHPGSCTIDFAQWAPPSRPTRPAVQAWAGETLRRLEKQGLVTRAPGRDYEIGDKHAHARGTEKRYVSQGLKKAHPSHAWWITGDGIRYLRRLDEDAAAQEAFLAGRAARQASAAQAIEEMRPVCDSVTSRHGRRVVAAELRDRGCTLDQIGALFGVSREMIRLDLLPAPEPRPRRVRQPKPTKKDMIRLVVAEEIAAAIEASLCAPSEQCAGRFCPDCIRYGQAQADAALARKIGGSPLSAPAAGAA